MTILNISRGVRNMLDLSTCHITKNDAVLLNSLAENEYSIPRVTKHAYGHIVFIGYSDSLDATITALADDGYSQAFRDIYYAAAKAEYIVLINFDRDGDVIPGLPVFDW